MKNQLRKLGAWTQDEYVWNAYEISSFTESTYEHINYTAFEVFPTDYEILEGTIDPDTNIKYSVSVPSCDTAYLDLYAVNYGTSDVVDTKMIIDWGDGTIVDVDDAINNNKKEEIGIDFAQTYEDNDILLYIKHKYVGDALNVKNTIKIKCENLMRLRGRYKKNTTEFYPNIISRILDADLKVANTVTNMSSCCNDALKLLRILSDNYNNIMHLSNCAGMFRNCKNLVSAKFPKPFIKMQRHSITGLFDGCENLEYTNMQMYACSGIEAAIGNTDSFQNMFRNCKSLDMDINEIIPLRFANRTVYMQAAFQNCLKLHGTIPALRLWNDSGLEILGTQENCFKGCTKLIETNAIPIDWKGTD